MFGLLGIGVGVNVDDCLGNNECVLGVLSVFNTGVFKDEQEKRKVNRIEERNNRIYDTDDLLILCCYFC